MDRYIWVIYCNNDIDDMPFFTCDEPILLTNTRGSELGLEKNALAKNTTVIGMALNERLFIALYPKESMLGQGLSRFEDERIPVKKEFVSRINRLLIKQSCRQVFVRLDKLETLKEVVKSMGV